MKLFRFDIINAGWNGINGFYFHLFDVDINTFDRTFIGVDISKNFFYLHLFFMQLKLYEHYGE